MHVFTLAITTQTGVQTRWWLEKVVSVLKKEKKEKTPAFCDEAGFMLSSKDIEAVIHPVLKTMQRSNEFADDIPRDMGVEDAFHCYRSFRRGAANTAIRNVVDEKTINFVHRWSTVEGRKKGVETSSNMLKHYADGVALRPKMLQFSSMIQCWEES